MTSGARPQTESQTAHRAVGTSVGYRLDRAWRTLATGFSFFTFGATGLLLGNLYFPLLNFFVRDRTRRRRVARATIAWNFRWFIGLMKNTGLLTYELRGFEKLNRNGLLVVSNHPSLIDTVFLLGFVRNSSCVVDDALYRNFFTLRPLQAAEFIRNDGGVNVMTQCVEALDQGTNVLIFPEGTRTPATGIIKMRRGASNVAVRADRNLTPVTIQCAPRTLMKGQKWWQIPDSPPHFTLAVGDDIPVQPFSRDDDSPALAVRRLTTYLEQYFTTQSQPHAIR